MTSRVRPAERSAPRDWGAVAWRWAALLFCVDFWLAVLKAVGVL